MRVRRCIVLEWANSMATHVGSDEEEMKKDRESYERSKHGVELKLEEARNLVDIYYIIYITRPQWKRYAPARPTNDVRRRSFTTEEYILAAADSQSSRAPQTVRTS